MIKTFKFYLKVHATVSSIYRFVEIDGLVDDGRGLRKIEETSKLRLKYLDHRRPLARAPPWLAIFHLRSITCNVIEDVLKLDFTVRIYSEENSFLHIRDARKVLSSKLKIAKTHDLS